VQNVGPVDEAADRHVHFPALDGLDVAPADAEPIGDRLLGEATLGAQLREAATDVT